MAVQRTRYGTPESTVAAVEQVQGAVRRDMGVAVITLNRPEKRNALSVPMRDRMIDLLHEFEADPDVRVIVFRGTGSSFSSGAEINEDWGQRGRYKRFTVSQSYLYASELTWGRGGFGQAIARSPKVTVCGVQGYCAAASYFLLASRCDLVIAGNDARIGALEARFMGPAAATASLHLFRILGSKSARFAGYTGDPLTAEQAEQAGFVHRVVPSEELDAEVSRTAQALAARPRPESEYLKRRIRMTESTLGTNAPVVSGLLTSHFLRREPDEHDFFATVKRGGVRSALDEELRRREQV